MSAAAGPEAVTTYPPAGLDRRFYAFALDRCVSWPVMALAAWIAYLVSWRDGGLWAGLALLLLGALAVLVAFAVALGLRGASPGKAVLGLRLVDAATGRPVGVVPALQRSLVLAAAGLPTFGLGLATLALTALSDPSRQRRGWHDRITGSIVVDVRPVTVAEEVADEAPRQVVNLTAMRLAPAPAAALSTPAPVTPARRTPVPATVATTSQAPPVPASAPPGPPPSPFGPLPDDSPAAWPAGQPDQTAVRGSAPGPSAATWRVTFDSGESLVVEGLALLGRRPQGRPGEPVRHLVPLTSQDMSVSKTHAQVQVAPDGALVVTDRGSTNGSFLVRAGAARELAPGRPTTLLAGDTVLLGDRSMTVHRDS